MKLGVSYTVWDGEELLEYSIKSIRNNVNFISVVWQKISNHGTPCSEGLEDLLKDLVNRGLVDALHLYIPDIANTGGINASLNETIKRNIGLELSRGHGCTHHMTIDTDEFYTDAEFKFMKEEMERENFGTGYCQHLQYYYDSIYQLQNPEQEYVATIEKITDKTRYMYDIPCLYAIDPTRKTNNVQEGLPYRVFERNECQMHHLSFVRKDIKKKLWNHSSRRFFTEEGVNKIAEYYKNWKRGMPAMWAGGNLLPLIEVPRQFEIYAIEQNELVEPGSNDAGTKEANGEKRLEKRSKPLHVKPSFYAYNFYPLKEIAEKYGYNLVLHGSLNRDMDLIAIPWAKDLKGTVPEMITEMCNYIGGWVLDESDTGRTAFRDMHHGRTNYIININRSGFGESEDNVKRKDGAGGFYEDAQYYLDISVTPIQ